MATKTVSQFPESTKPRTRANEAAKPVSIEFTEADRMRYIDKPWEAIDGLLNLLKEFEPEGLESVWSPNAVQCLKWTANRVSWAFFEKIHDGFAASREDSIPFGYEDLKTYTDVVMPLITIATLHGQHEDKAEHGAIRVIRCIADDCLIAIHDLDGRLAAVAHPDLFATEERRAQESPAIWYKREPVRIQRGNQGGAHGR
jgi:hypothetical protein